LDVPRSELSVAGTTIVNVHPAPIAVLSLSPPPSAFLPHPSPLTPRYHALHTHSSAAPPRRRVNRTGNEANMGIMMLILSRIAL
jgi:hypothetical protein